MVVVGNSRAAHSAQLDEFHLAHFAYSNNSYLHFIYSSILHAKVKAIISVSI